MKDVKPEDIDWDNPPFKLTDVDKEVLATKEEDCVSVSWDDLKHIIGTYRVNTRYPGPHYYVMLC